MRRLTFISATVSVASLAVSTASLAGPYGGPPDFHYLSKCLDLRLSLDERISFCQNGARDGDNQGREIAKFELARLSAIDGKYDAALALANNLLETRHTQKARIPALELRSVIYAQMGRYNDAVADGNEIVQLDTNEAHGYNARCWIRAVAGRDLGQALSDCNQALAASSGNSNASDVRGLVNLKLGHLQEALADYNTAIGDNPKAAVSRFARGVVQIKLGNAKSGSEDIAEATQRYSDVAKEMASYGVTIPIPIGN